MDKGQTHARHIIRYDHPFLQDTQKLSGAQKKPVIWWRHVGYVAKLLGAPGSVLVG